MSAMLLIEAEMVTRIASAFWPGSMVRARVGANLTEGLSGQATQHGMVGLILTLLLVTTPMIVSQLFNGTLGSLQQLRTVSTAAYSACGSGARRPLLYTGTARSESVSRGGDRRRGA